MIYIGIDPGMSGGVALRFIASDSAVAYPFDTEAGMRECLEIYDASQMFAMIERVHSMPRQGVASTFKFGQNYGFWRGLLIGLRIPFEEVTPRKWQTEMGCLTGGDKNVSKARAGQLFPNIKVTHAIADALLIAEYCRRVRA